MTVNVDRSQLTQDTTYFKVDLNYNNMNKSVVVRVLSFFEDKISLNGNVVDAAYERNSRQLYYLNTNPNQLVKFDLTTEQFQTLSLSYTPICFSLSSSGSYAAIGNDGNATLVDLNNFSVINTFNTGTLPSDVAIKDSAFVYVFPEVGTHVRVQCVDLQNNYSITQNTGWTISDQSKAALHPIQDAIYVADNGVSPSDIEKLDISSGTANLLYDSPYHGDYNMGGDLWISNDGSRLITRGRTVLQTTTNQSTDLIYSGSVQLNIPQELMNGRPNNYFVIQSLDEDALNDKLVLTTEDGTFSSAIIDQVYLHQASTLQYLQSFDLESFVVPNQTSGKYDHYKADPFFTCFTGYGDEILVITKGTGSGLSNPWGMELINP